MTGSPSPFKRGTKIFRRLFLHIGLYDGRDLSNILAPERGEGGGQGLHLGTPRGTPPPCLCLPPLWLAPLYAC